MQMNFLSEGEQQHSSEAFQPLEGAAAGSQRQLDTTNFATAPDASFPSAVAAPAAVPFMQQRKIVPIWIYYLLWLGIAVMGAFTLYFGYYYYYPETTSTTSSESYNSARYIKLSSPFADDEEDADSPWLSSSTGGLYQRPISRLATPRVATPVVEHVNDVATVDAAVESAFMVPGVPDPIFQGSGAMNSLLPNHPQYPNTTLIGQVKTHTLLSLLSRVYDIALSNGGNRAIQNPGFNATIAFIEETVKNRTVLVNFEKSYFNYVINTTVTNPQFIFTAAGQPAQALNYPQNYTFFANSASLSTAIPTETVYVANGGCMVADWDKVLGASPPQRFWVIVDNTPATNCTDNIRIGAAQLYGAVGVIISNTINGNTARLRAPETTKIVVISMTRVAAKILIDAITFGGTSAVTVAAAATLTKNVVVVTNICADTPYGDPTSVVLVGGHSDGVAAGPGTNDDGSGTVATLTLAIGMSRLMTQTNYRPVNMVKFCWFGGEEVGLLGSAEVVRVGVLRDVDPTARVGSRAKDWAIMIDLDMLGSSNYQNWVYDANQYIPPNTPERAHYGSKIQSNLFFEFFDNNRLPRDSDTFDGRSDYGPFLVAGIPAGGVDAGADKTKTEAQRVRYLSSTGWGGVSGAINDQCYHRICDTISNIHWGVYTNMTMSAAYVLETLATKPSLRQYLQNPLMEAADAAQHRYSYLPFEFRFQVDVATEDEPMQVHF